MPMTVLGVLMAAVVKAAVIALLLVAWIDLLDSLCSPIPVQQEGGNGDMAGYLNRFIDLGFPDLGGVDDNQRAIVWVKIRNPRLMTGDEIFAETDGTVQIGADGKPVGDVKAEAVYKSFARLVIAGNVWDATSLDDDPPLIPMPPSPTDMGKMPMEILNRIGEELSKLNPK